jgi:AraC-like DNA-binding protein
MSGIHPLHQLNVDAAEMPIVTIQINSVNCSEILTYFIIQKIPFRLSHLIPNSEKMAESTIKRSEPEAETSNGKTENSRLNSVYDRYIIQGFERSLPPIEEIAAETGMSASSFKNHFKKIYGKSFFHLYMEHKMEYAAKLLEQGHSASTISKRIGYSQPIKFNQIFQKHFGVTPKKYQREKGR